MNLFTNQKQTHRHRKQTYGCQYIYIYIQQGFTV